MRDFAEPLPQASLNIEEKNRSNIFAWRGQFSPQLVESLLAEYCPPDSVVVDPFAGSGTVLHEAARRSLPAFGFEINPSAWCFSKLYELSAVSQETRREATLELQDQINREFPLAFFAEDRELGEEEVEEKVIRMGESLSARAKIICNALVVLLDIYKNRYGEPIREDVLSLRKEGHRNAVVPIALGRSLARDFLHSALQRVPEKNKALLIDAIDRIDRIDGTPIFDSSCYTEYQMRDKPVETSTFVS